MAESRFKMGDVVCLKSAPHIPLTVSLVTAGAEDSFWLHCIYYDEETKKYRPMGIRPAVRQELFDFYRPPQYEDPFPPVGYK